jgi:hypothetical protein
MPSSVSDEGQGNKIRDFGHDFAPLSAVVCLQPSAHVGVRNSLHQFADFRFQKLISHDQGLYSVPGITTAELNRFVRRRFKLVRVGLWTP